MATLEEIARIIGILKMAYPNFGSRLTENEWAALPRIWHRLLVDLPSELIEAATMNFITSSGSAFPPSIAELRDSAYRLVNYHELSPEEAWGQATQKIGGISEPDPIVRQTIKIMGTAYFRFRLEENESVDRAHFFRIYDTLRKRRREAAMMLPEVRSVVERLRIENRLRLKEG